MPSSAAAASSMISISTSWSAAQASARFASSVGVSRLEGSLARSRAKLAAPASDRPWAIPASTPATWSECSEARSSTFGVFFGDWCRLKRYKPRSSPSQIAPAISSVVKPHSSPSTATARVPEESDRALRAPLAAALRISSRPICSAGPSPAITTLEVSVLPNVCTTTVSLTAPDSSPEATSGARPPSRASLSWRSAPPSRMSSSLVAKISRWSAAASSAGWPLAMMSMRVSQ